MGLDDFSSKSTDGDEQQEEVDNEEQEETTPSKEKPPKKDNGPNIEDYKKYSDSSKGAGSTDEGGVPDPVIGELTSEEWNSMSKIERVKYVRENHIPDYRPSVHIDDRWEWDTVIEVQCVCDNVFTFSDSGLCLACGRTYVSHGSLNRRVVELLHEPQESQESNVSQEH